VVGVVQRVEPVRQQFDCLAYATRLIDAALLGDRQMHRQVQKSVVLSVSALAKRRQRRINIGQRCVVFGVLVHPQGSYCFYSFKRLFCLGFGINRAKKLADIGFGGVEHDAGIVAAWACLTPLP